VPFLGGLPFYPNAAKVKAGQYTQGEWQAPLIKIDQPEPHVVVQVESRTAGKALAAEAAQVRRRAKAA
jgi:hypothetical protein